MTTPHAPAPTPGSPSLAVTDSSFTADALSSRLSEVDLRPRSYSIQAVSGPMNSSKQEGQEIVHSQNQQEDQDGLDEFLEEAVWYERYQDAFISGLRSAIQETETEIVRAHRSLNGAERSYRDTVAAGAGDVAGLRKMEEEIGGLDHAIAKLERKGMEERELLGRLTSGEE